MITRYRQFYYLFTLVAHNQISQTANADHTKLQMRHHITCCHFDNRIEEPQKMYLSFGLSTVYKNMHFTEFGFSQGSICLLGQRRRLWCTTLF